MALTAVGVGVRMIDLGEAPFWRDEATFAFWAKLSVRDLVAALRRDVHAPLAYLLLGAWSKLAGTSEAGLRSLGAILGGLTPAVLFLMTRRSIGPAAATAAGVLLALNPGHIMYCQQLSPYPLLILLTVVSMGLSVRLADRDAEPLLKSRRAHVVLLALVLAALAYTHMWAVMVWAAVGVALALAAVIERRRSSRWPSWIWRFGVAVLTALVLFLPWLTVSLAQAGSRTMDHLLPTPAASAIFVQSTRFWYNNLSAMGLAGAALLLFLGFGLGWWRRSPSLPHGFVVATLLAAALIVVPHVVCLLSAPWRTLYDPRYTLICVPAMVLVMGVLLAKVRPRVLMALSTAAVALVPLTSGVKHGLCVASAVYAPSPLKQLAADMKAALVPGDVIVIYPEIYASTFNWYFQGDTPQVCYPALGRIEVVDWHSYADRVEDAQAPQRAIDYLLSRRGPTGRIWVAYNPSYQGRRMGIDYGKHFFKFLALIDQHVPNSKQTTDTYMKGERFDAQQKRWIHHGGDIREPVTLTIGTPRLDGPT